MRLFAKASFAAFFFALGTAFAQPPKVVAVDVDGIIHPITVEIVEKAITEAQKVHASLVLIRLNTPGGLLDAARDVVQRIVASPIPVVTYVTPSGSRAASAGFFLLEAGDVAAMAPGTNTGAASPVLLVGQMDDTMRRKVENDSTAWIRGITGHRGRNSDLAQETITQAKAFTGKEALNGHLIELIAGDQSDLFSQLDGREITRWNGTRQTLHTAGAQVIEMHRTLREEVMSALADPNLAFIFLVVGALGIYVEFTSPGLIVPGILGAILAMLGLAGLSVLSLSWTGIGLLLLALALFILEVKFSSHGILGIGGAVCMVLGALFLVEGPPEMRIHLLTALSVALPFALITMFLVSLVVRAQKNKAITGIASMVGEIGITRTPLAPDGQILVRGEYWGAISSSPLNAGVRVRIRAIDGMTLKVDPIA